jgi:putative ABC transport system permease protein
MSGMRRVFQFPSRTARHIERDVDDELQFHLEMRTEALVAIGCLHAEARAQALREFGDLDDARRSISAMDRGTEAIYQRRDLVSDLAYDFRYSLRKLRRSPGFAAALIATLALGIGATTAIFSVVNGVLLEPLPYAKADRIVRLYPIDAKGERQSVTQPNYRDWAQRLHDFAALAIFHPPYKVTVTGLGEPLKANFCVVSRDFFAVFSTRPELGRPFSDEETRYGGPRAAIVSDAFWRQHLGGSRSALGRRMTIEGQLYSIVGVMPAAMNYPAANDVWVPTELFQESTSRTSGGWAAIGRARDGESMVEVARSLSQVSRHMKSQYGDETNMSDARVIPLHDQIVGNVRTPLLVLLVASAALLLIAIANAVNLLVARLALRQGELAVRVAIGATQGRLTRQLLVEALTLSLTGGVVGIAFAGIATRQLVQLDGANIPRAGNVHVDMRVLVFAAAVSLLTALVLGLLAAWHAARRDVRETLSAHARSSTGNTARIRSALVVAQMASTVVLLVGAGVLGRSFLQLMSVKPGFRTNHLLIVDASPDLSGAELAAFEQRLLDRLRVLPGVVAVGGAAGVPLAGSAPDGTYLLLKSVAEAPPAYSAPLWKTPGRSGSANYARVEGEFFNAMGIPVLQGRAFGTGDSPNAPHVAVINAAFAHSAWPNADPIGKVVEFGNMDGNMKPFTIVGVVGDTHDDGLASAPTPTLYAYMPQRLSGWAPTIVVQTSANPTAMIAPMRRILGELGPTLAPEFQTMDHVVSASVADRRFMLLLIFAFGGSALLMSTLGVYSVVSYLVAQRTPEIGVRVALGAQRVDVVRLILSEGGRLAAVGIVVGVGGSLLLTRLLRGLVFGVSVTDPVAYTAVIALLIVVALIASYIPALRAARVDPIAVIRAT